MANPILRPTDDLEFCDGRLARLVARQGPKHAGFSTMIKRQASGAIEGHARQVPATRQHSDLAIADRLMFVQVH